MGVTPTYDVLCIGNPFCDRTAFVDEKFLSENNLEKGVTTQADKTKMNRCWESMKNASANTWSFGGSGANVVKALSSLGHSCALCGRVGSDNIGQEIEQRLEKMKIYSLITKGDEETGTVNCFITSNGERTMQTYVGACANFTERDFVPNQFENVKLVHLEGYTVLFGKTLEKSINLAKKNNAMVSLDLASHNIVQEYKSKFNENILKVDFLFGNAEEMKTLADTETVEEALATFDTEIEAIATLGEKGSLVKKKGASDSNYYKAIKVEDKDVIDTTGAGDFFAAGYLSEVLNGKDVDDRVKKGNQAASLVIQYKGTDVPDKKLKSTLC